MSSIEYYLEAFASELKVSAKAKERILAETEDHLRERAEREEARGASRAVAQSNAIKSFGPATKVADDFVVEQATQTARHAFSQASLSTMLVFVCAAINALDLNASDDFAFRFSASFTPLILTIAFILGVSPLIWPLLVAIRRRHVSVMKASDCMAMSYGALGSVCMAIIYAADWSASHGLPTSLVIGAAMLGALIALRPAIEAIRLAYEARTVERAGILAAHREARRSGQKPATTAPIGLFDLMLEPAKREVYVPATRTVRRASVGAVASLALVYATGWSQMAGLFDPSIGGADGKTLSILSFALLIGCAASLHRNTGVATMPIAELYWLPALAILCVICTLGTCAGLIDRGASSFQLVVLTAAVGCAAFSLVEAIRGLAAAHQIRAQEAREESDWPSIPLSD